MDNHPSERKQQRATGSRPRRLLLTLALLGLAAIIVSLLVIGRAFSTPDTSRSNPTSTPITAGSPLPTATQGRTAVPTPRRTATAAPTPTQPATLSQRIDAYINNLTQTQQIGQLLMLAVYSDGYTTALNQPLQQWKIANVIVFNQYNGGQLLPPTLSGWTQEVHDLQAHANQRLIVATDEEGGIVDRLAPYYGSTPSPQQLADSGNPQQAYAQGRLDAQRLLASGINTDFAPLADIYQGGAVDQSRMFGTTASQVTTYAGSFLDGLQQNGVEGTLKHWPGLGAAPANPDFGLPTVLKSQAQLNAVDFASFRALLAHRPGMIMVTHVIVPAYDSKEPATLSPVLIDQVLRGQLGYQGVVVTDAMDGQGLLQFMQQQGYSNPASAIAEASVRAILAGNDIVECPIESDRLAATVAAVTAAVQSGRISQTRLRQSLRRIIALKVHMGLIALP